MTKKNFENEKTCFSLCVPPDCTGPEIHNCHNKSALDDMEEIFYNILSIKYCKIFVCLRLSIYL